MPGFFIQSDLLAKIGAFIQPRSDTFTIRTFGSALNTPGEREEKGHAYYEIVVQRIPDYVDDTIRADDPPTSSTNERFGRRYKIISQRWLSPNTI